VGPQAAEELAPEALGLDLADVQADHFAAAAVVHAVGDRKRLMAHPISERSFRSLGVVCRVTGRLLASFKARPTTVVTWIGLRLLVSRMAAAG
jgi:hypothetical protein